MKAIINRRKYDTETAECVGVNSHGYYNDFAWYEERLYRKKTGEYFLYGTGGPMSKYAKAIAQNTVSGGSVIVPMTIDEAKNWVEENMSGDEYENVFGEVAE